MYFVQKYISFLQGVLPEGLANPSKTDQAKNIGDILDYCFLVGSKFF
jgi:hypothetical protein